MRASSVVLLAGLALGACARKPAAPTLSAIAQQAEIRRMLPNIPDYAQAYSGAVINSTEQRPDGGVLVYSANASVDQIVNFYRSTADTAQLTARFDSASVSQPTDPKGVVSRDRVLSFSAPGTRRSLYVDVQPTSDGAADVGMVYGSP